MALALCLMLGVGALAASLQFESARVSIEHTAIYAILGVLAALMKSRQREVMVAALTATLPLIFFYGVYLHHVYVVYANNPLDPNIGFGLAALLLPFLTIAAGVGGWRLGAKSRSDYKKSGESP